MRARGLPASACIVLASACGANVPSLFDGPAGGDDTDAPPGTIDAPNATPDAMLGPWSAPQMIPTAGTPDLGEDDGTVSPLETELYFSGKLAGVNKDIYQLTRMSPADPWGPASLVAELDTGNTEQTPRFFDDGLTLYFSTSRAGGPGNDDIWIATRDAVGLPWNPPAVVPDVNSGADERTLTPCAGNRYLMISFRGGTGDVWEGRFGQAPTLVTELSDPAAQETGTFISADCLRAWFASNRDGTTDIFYAHRANPQDAWIFDGKDTDLSTDIYDESDPMVSADGHRMVLTSTLDGGENDLYTSTR